MTKPDTPAEVALARANQALWEIQRQKRAREAELRQAVDELKRQHAEQVAQNEFHAAHPHAHGR